MAEDLNLRRNVVYAIAEFGIGIALLFLSYRLIIWQGGLAALGLWSTLYAWTTLIRVGDVGMASTTMRFVALHDVRSAPDRVAEYLETGLISQAVIHLILAIVGYFCLSPIIGTIVGAEHRAEAEAVLPFLFCGFVLMNVSGAVLGGLQGLHLGYVRSQLSVFGTFLQLVGVVLLVPHLQLVGLAVAQIVQHAVVGFVGWLLLRRYGGSRNWLPQRFSRLAFYEMLRFSLGAQVVNTATGLFEPLSKMLVGAFAGLHVLGLYELAYKTVLLPRNTVVAGISASVPAMSRLLATDRELAYALYRKSVRRSTLAMAGVGLLLVVAAPVASLLMTSAIEPTYLWFCAILFVGALVNTNGAAAYSLGLASALFGGNIVVSLAALGLLVGLGIGLGTIMPIYGVVLSAAAGLALIGIGGRVLNEKIVFKQVGVQREATKLWL